MNFTLIDGSKLTPFERDYERVVNRLLEGKYLSCLTTGDYILMDPTLDKPFRDSQHVRAMVVRRIELLNSGFHKNKDGRWVIE